ncbi:MAG: hypothetical protein H0W72_12745 [Planctomycetes bacterium]|nr:hypothetical protein [Planctomycetota bacterium]
MLAALVGGCLAGALHVVSGPDHLAAIAPLAVRRPGRAWSTGLRWGLGHGAGSATICATAWACGLFAQAEIASAWSERAVGLVLIGIGAWSLWRVRSDRRSGHVHTHGAIAHAHAHQHRAAALIDLGGIARAGIPAPVDRTRLPLTLFPASAHGHRHSPFAIGALHGLAGGSHLVVVVPALALPWPQAAGYCAAFGLASIAAMVAFAGGLGVFADRIAGLQRIHLGLQVVVAFIAIAIGSWWLTCA